MSTDRREIGGEAVWSLSTAKPGNGVEQIRDDNVDTYWQSDGVQPHLINIQFHKKMSIVEVALYLDFTLDESYTPKKIIIKAGTTFHDLTEIESVELHEPSGWVRIPLSIPTPKLHNPSLAQLIKEVCPPNELKELNLGQKLLQAQAQTNGGYGPGLYRPSSKSGLGFTTAKQMMRRVRNQNRDRDRDAMGAEDGRMETYQRSDEGEQSEVDNQSDSRNNATGRQGNGRNNLNNDSSNEVGRQQTLNIEDFQDSHDNNVNISSNDPLENQSVDESELDRDFELLFGNSRNSNNNESDDYTGQWDGTEGQWSYDLDNEGCQEYSDTGMDIDTNGSRKRNGSKKGANNQDDDDDGSAALVHGLSGEATMLSLFGTTVTIRDGHDQSGSTNTGNNQTSGVTLGRNQGGNNLNGLAESNERERSEQLTGDMHVEGLPGSSDLNGGPQTNINTSSRSVSSHESDGSNDNDSQMDTARERGTGEGMGMNSEGTGTVVDGEGGEIEEISSQIDANSLPTTKHSSTAFGASKTEATTPAVLRAHLLQICIAAMHQNGRDTHIRQAKVYGPRLSQNPTWFLGANQTGITNIQEDHLSFSDENENPGDFNSKDKIQKKIEIQALAEPSTVTFKQFNAIR